MAAIEGAGYSASTHANLWSQKRCCAKVTEVVSYVVKAWFCPCRVFDCFRANSEMINRANKDNHYETRHWEVKRNTSLIIGALLFLGACAMTKPLITLKFKYSSEVLLSTIIVMALMSGISCIAGNTAQSGLEEARKQQPDMLLA